MERESFKSRLGFLLVSAGCAIGIGNVWKFPYVAGQSGGGIFVLFYLFFLVIIGAPVLIMELAVGRASRKSAVKAYQALEPKDTKWHIHGWVCIAANMLLMMYYTTVCGWMLNYAIKYLTGSFAGLTAEETGGVFAAMTASPAQMLGFMALSVAIGVAVCSFGLENGIERITKVMMLGLLALIAVLAVHSLTLPGAGAGVSFYLLPDFARAKQEGLREVITAAMNQSFFTLSLGIGSMEIFGSYMSRDFTLGNESLRICALDTFVAIMAGVIIFPACFSYGVEPDSGPSLIFVTLPKVFANMGGGRVWGMLFFVFMSFASLSTVIAVFENLIATCMDSFGWSRRVACTVLFVATLALSVPCALGSNVLGNVRLIGGRDVLNTEDFIVSNVLLPTGALVFLLFCVTRWGWGFRGFQEEANLGKGVKIANALRFYLTWILPALILVIFIQGLIG